MKLKDPIGTDKLIDPDTNIIIIERKLRFIERSILEMTLLNLLTKHGLLMSH